MPGSSEKVMPASERGGVAADEVGPLVAVHADAVAEAVGEVVVVGAVAGIGDDLAGGGVDRVAGHAGTRGGKRRRLRAMDDVEDILHLVGGLAEDKGARDVGFIALDRAAVVDQDDRAFADDLRLERAMRQRGVFADLAAGVAGESDAVVGGADQLR